ncbi:hypothetical protein L1987_09106 [Smallanthus sonchifolius]|uniref:Uncharacterized protein n=1 Tax=Smallanthus sonchifolius TaxID=185202 RepID=A0ACB9JP76_9ASTR|nr:hypothetical protein L1987_09106 [Smallanthus sonchifolius]
MVRANNGFDVNSFSDSDSSYVSACSTNSVCDVSDCMSEVSSDSTFFDKVVHTAREYIPIHKMSCLAKDVVLDEFGNPLIQDYYLSHERPKKNEFIFPENHILTSEGENVKSVQIKISTPTKSQKVSGRSNQMNFKGKSNDVKDQFIDVKDKLIQSKGKSVISQSSIEREKGKSMFEVGECSKVNHHYSRDYFLSRDHNKLYSNAYHDYVLPNFVDKKVQNSPIYVKKSTKPSYFDKENFNKKYGKNVGYFWKVKIKQTSHISGTKNVENLKEQVVSQTGMTINNAWHVDSSYSRHMTGQREILKDFRSFEGGFVAFAGDKKLEFNLLSVSQVCDKDIPVHFTAKECLLLKPGLVIPEEMILMRAPRKFNTYVVDMNNHSTPVSVSCLLSKATGSESYLWHR